jgi:uncharacterized delta-60 repeat protein
MRPNTGYHRILLLVLTLIGAGVSAQQLTYTQDLAFQTVTPTPARAGYYQLYPYGPAHFVAHAAALVDPADFIVYDSLGQATGLHFSFHPAFASASPQQFFADASGHAYIAGTYADTSILPISQSQIVVAKYLPNGDPDSSWGQQGIWYGDTAANGFGGVIKLQVLATGAVMLIDRPLSAGTSSPYFYLRRLTPTGQLDPTFGTQGSTWMNSDNRPASAFYLAADGSAYAVLNFGTPANATLARWLADGTRDTAFAIPGSARDILNILPDGRIVSDGYTIGGGWGLRRHLSNGTPDNTYTAPAINTASNFSFPVHGGGRIYYHEQYNGTPYAPAAEFTILRPDGSLDPAYMPAGQPMVLDIPTSFWPGPGCHNDATPSFGELLAIGPRRLIYADALSAQVPIGGSHSEYEDFTCPRIVSLVTDLQTVGQPEPATASGLTLWPNPIGDHLSLYIPTRAKSAQVQLYDLAGKPIRLPSATLTPVAGGLQYDFQGLSDLPSGLYLLRVMAGGQQFAVKLHKV